MTKTENLNLPQWVAEDPFQREDFNEAFAALDEGYQTALEVSAAAVTTAGNAEDKAEAAQTAADNAAALAVSEAAAARPYVIGTYTGNGGSQTITVGFKPSAVLTFAVPDTSTNAQTQGGHFMFSEGSILSTRLVLTSTGFTVNSGSTYTFPNINASDILYAYLALK